MQKVLIACEFSGIIREAFKKLGFDAWSCDLHKTEIPGNHIIGNALSLLHLKWDLIIGHPPCTYLCRQSARWNKTPAGQKLIRSAADFFNIMKNAPCDRICIENPIPHKAAAELIGKYSQIIQPYQYGHDYSKSTGLWLQGLPLLKPTKLVDVSYIVTNNGRRFTKGWYETPRNWRARSRSFTGIADAMALQWGAVLRNEVAA